jgi:hypothetical protein
MELELSELELEQMSGQLPLDDISADGGGQLTKVGPPYDGSGGVVRGVERRMQADHPAPGERPFGRGNL